MGSIGTPHWNLRVLGYWQLGCDGDPVSVGARQQRLIAALALHGPRPRHVVAGMLWPNSPEHQAAGNLRASVFRISHELRNLLHAGEPLDLDPRVRVDLHGVRELIGQITLSGGLLVPPDAIDRLREASLLPGWYDNWVLAAQDRLEEQRGDALEILARDYLANGDRSRALASARAATEIDPLRESAQLTLMRCHLAADDHALALQAYREFRIRLWNEWRVAPSARFAELLGRAAEPVTRR